MKGQATIEYLMIFSTTLALLSLLATALATEEASLRDKAEDLEMAVKADSAARALESALNSGGIQFDFRDEGVYYSVEHGRFHAHHEGKLIEVGGVFRDSKDEPV